MKGLFIYYHIFIQLQPASQTALKAQGNSLKYEMFGAHNYTDV